MSDNLARNVAEKKCYEYDLNIVFNKEFLNLYIDHINSIKKIILNTNIHKYYLLGYAPLQILPIYSSLIIISKRSVSTITKN